MGRETSSLDLPTMSIGSIFSRRAESARDLKGTEANQGAPRASSAGAAWNRGARVRARGEVGRGEDGRGVETGDE